VRLTGIDAPELKQDFGTASRKTLADLVFGKQVTVVDHGHDRYNRTLADIRIGRMWINFEMINRGMAWMYRAYSKDPVLNAAENGAHQLRSGLWAQPNPIPPWLFRKQPVQRP
jgi:micrococcal nuclease